MAISRRPPKKPKEETGDAAPLRESAISAVIGRGGSAPKPDAIEEPELKRLQLRLYAETIEEIDQEVARIRAARRKPKFSRHKWLEEAIEEKLARDEK